MMFKKRIDRAFKWLKDKKNLENSIDDFNPKEEEEEIHLEKEDYIALFLSSLIVFGPIFLVLIIILLIVVFI